jgi:hypothetical protein
MNPPTRSSDDVRTWRYMLTSVVWLVVFAESPIISFILQPIVWECMAFTMWCIEFRTIVDWYVANLSIIFDAPCLFYTNCFLFCLHFVAFLCIFWN